MGKVILTYWKLRGKCEPINYILEYGGIDYEMRYMDGDLWAKEKPQLDLDYPNLPHMVDGNVRMSETNAICKYLAGKCGLLPTTAEEIRNSNMTEGILSDVTNAFFGLMTDPNYNTVKEQKIAGVKNLLALFEKVLSKRSWLAGGSLTWNDFVFYERIDVYSMMLPGLLDSFPNMKKYKAKMDNLEKIKAYRKSDRFHAYPVTPAGANWGVHKL